MMFTLDTSMAPGIGTSSARHITGEPASSATEGDDQLLVELATLDRTLRGRVPAHLMRAGTKPVLVRSVVRTDRCSSSW